MTWTQFWDMHSGGCRKEPPYHYIYVEAPEEEASVVFYNRFGHNPNRVTCTCCGEDYSINSHEDLAQLTGFHRGCHKLVTPQDPKTGLYQNDDPVIKAHLYLEDGEEAPKGYEIDADFPIFHSYQTLEEYVKNNDVLVIPASSILESERIGDVPEQGYVWRD